MIPRLEEYKMRWHVESERAIKPGLAAILEALEALGNPQNTLKVVHFAGTNGKGSTLTFVEHLARQHDLTVGKFMSPCIVDVHDQIQINGRPIKPKEMDAIFQQLVAAGLSGKLTDFELLTTAAFIHFKEQQVDLVCLEVGMGGREDSTNVVIPIVSVIPSIALEHTNFLGNTLTLIAHHKGGIIKDSKPTVIGHLPEEAREVIQQIAKEKNAPLYEIGKQFDIKQHGNGEEYINSHRQLTISGLQRQMLGIHQGHNMALAITAFFEVADALKIEVIEEKVHVAIREAQLAGRFEEVLPNIYFEGAHNPASIRTLVHTVKKHFPSKNIEFVMGILADKDVEEILTILEEVSDTFYFVNIANDRAMEATKIYQLSHAGNKIIIDDVVAFLQQPVENCIRIVTGSLYLLSEIRRKLNA